MAVAGRLKAGHAAVAEGRAMAVHAEVASERAPLSSRQAPMMPVNAAMPMMPLIVATET